MVMFLLMTVQKFNLVVCFSVLEYKFRVITACFMQGLLHAAFHAACMYRNALLLNHQSIMDFTTYSLVFFPEFDSLSWTVQLKVHNTAGI